MEPFIVHIGLLCLLTGDHHERREDKMTTTDRVGQQQLVTSTKTETLASTNHFVRSSSPPVNRTTDNRLVLIPRPPWVIFCCLSNRVLSQSPFVGCSIWTFFPHHTLNFHPKHTGKSFSRCEDRSPSNGMDPFKRSIHSCSAVCFLVLRSLLLVAVTPTFPATSMIRATNLSSTWTSPNWLFRK